MIGYRGVFKVNAGEVSDTYRAERKLGAWENMVYVFSEAGFSFLQRSYHIDERLLQKVGAKGNYFLKQKSTTEGDALKRIIILLLKVLFRYKLSYRIIYFY